jgi:ribosome-binding protein aMBF1 (putative translation factor)
MEMSPLLAVPSRFPHAIPRYKGPQSQSCGPFFCALFRRQGYYWNNQNLEVGMNPDDFLVIKYAGNAIKRMRLKSGISQIEFARRLHRAQSHVSKIEANRQWVTDSDIEAIAAALNLSVTHVLRQLLDELSKKLNHTVVVEAFTNLGE